MDRYVLVVVINLEAKKEGTFNGIEAVKKLHDSLKDISSTNSTSRISSLPACSLSGSPASQKWYFAIQVTQGPAQLCSSEWEEVYMQCSDSEESVPSEVENYISALQQQEEQVLPGDIVSHAELFEEAAEALHQLADKLPPPGRFLLDVILLCEDEVMVKDFLPVIGSLKHMQAWHSAQMTVVTEHNAGWQAAASYLSGRVCSPSLVESCIDVTELWRGGLLIREKKFASELLFEGYSLKRQNQSCLSQVFYPQSNLCSITDHMTQHEVFHYYQQVLELIQLVRVTDLPVILHCSTEFELALSSRSAKAKLLLDQLRALRGGVGALFSLSCVVSSEALPPVSQLSASKWRDFVAECPKVLSAPDVEVKGEKGHYLLLVQGSDTGRCRARLINSANQINGSVPLATVQSHIWENIPSSSGTDTADWLRSLPRLCGDDLMRREKRLARVQLGAVQECARRREEAQKPASVPLNNVKLLLRLARERYLNMCNATLPKASPCAPAAKQKHVSVTGANVANLQWPERSVLRNYENMQKIRHRNRSRLFSSGSSECLMGPKDVQKSGSAPLDARELLKHFTPDGLPSGELQPLPVLRGENAFQLSSDLTPRKVTKLPFRQAANSRYHGIEFCLDEGNALERDRGFASLQSRLIRFETQTTCCKEPCPVPLALSPMPTSTPTPSPSEPGSVPDGETAHSEPPLLKRHSREPEALAHQHKRLAKSESSESLGSQCNGGSSKHPKVRALQQQAGRSLSSSGSNRHSAAGAETSHEPSPSQKPSQCPTESRSQKHNRMLKEVVAKTLKHYGITSEHECFKTCSQRLFDVSKLYLKDLKTSRGLHEEMKKAAGRNAKQVIDWVVEKASKK